MNRLTIVPLACLALAACNQPAVSLTNASPEEVAKAAQASGAKIQMRPGQWETKIEILKMDMPGMEKMPAEYAEKMKAELMKPRTVESCMTEEDLKDRQSKIFTGGGDSKCKFEKYEMSGGSIDAVMNCPGPAGDMKMKMKGSFSGDTFTVNQEMDMKGPTGNARSEARITGKRTGECPAAPKK